MLGMILIAYLTATEKGDEVAVFLIAGLGFLELIAEIVFMFSLTGVK